MARKRIALKDPREGRSYVLCRLCRQPFLAISYAHLRYRHGRDPDHPIYEYRKQFGLRTSECRSTQARRLRSLIRVLERIGRRWTRDRVIRGIRARKAHHRPLNVGAVRDDGQRNIVHAALRIFGSWDRALAAAGIRPDDVRAKRHWTRDKVLSGIKELGRFVGCQVVMRTHRPLVYAAIRLFGSWENAYKAAAIPYTPWSTQRKWSREQILSTIRSRAERSLPLTPGLVNDDLPGLFRAANRVFGGWESALIAAGYGDMLRAGSLPGQVRPWTRDEIVAELRKLRAAGKSVSALSLRSHRPPGYESLRTGVERVFGKLSAAKQAAGFGDWAKRTRGRWTRQAVLETIRERARRGASLRHPDICRELGGLYAASRRLYGTWTRARAAAGVART